MLELLYNLSGILALATSSAAIIVGSTISRHFYKSLKEEHKNMGMEIVRAPFSEPNSLSHELQIDHLDESLKEHIQEFQQTLESIPHINKDSFYRNIKSVRVKVYNKSLLRHIVLMDRGLYFPLENKLELMGNKRSTTFHELFHLSSSTAIDENIYVSGFQTTYDSDEYCKGTGIDEGYTELLTDRYFKEKKVLYPDLVLICELLELIAGREVMEKCYFENNLKGLGEAIDEFLGVSYDNPEEDPFAILIARIDFYFDMVYEDMLFMPAIKEYKNIIFNILMLLALGVERSVYIGDLRKAEKLLNAIHAATPLLTKKKKQELKMFLIKIQDEIKDFSPIDDVSKCIEGTPKIMTIKSVRKSLQNN